MADLKTERLIVEVQRDHLHALARVRRPTVAICELIWNALDADANSVVVNFAESALGGIETITVVDDGNGIAWEIAQETFKCLGGSWKRKADKSQGGRKLHGSKGQGRFRAFGLGRRVDWESWSRTQGQRISGIQISGDYATIQQFSLSPVSDGRRRRTGTRVTITEIEDDRGLLGDQAIAHLAETFAPYLLRYPTVQRQYNGSRITPDDYIKMSKEISIVAQPNPDGEPHGPNGSAMQQEAVLQIVEWKQAFERKLHICDEDGFALAEFPMRIHAPGVSFSAYLRSALFTDLENEGGLDLADMHPIVRGLTTAARDALKDYYADRRLEDARRRLEKWKEEKIYPFTDAENSTIDEARRKVFDMCAVQIDDRLPGFSDENVKSKRLTFSLLKKAIDRDPDETRLILSEVLGLSAEEKKDFASFLKTRPSAR